MSREGPQRPLEGIRVLALEQFAAGPYGSMFLTDFGAEVIKIEAPGIGEGGRNIQPYVENERGRTSYAMVSRNRGKKSLSLNLQKEEGREIFRRLAGVSDVVWENMRPGVMDKLGLGYRALRALNPKIIYASISGFGHGDIYQSPYIELPAFDIAAQAMSGLMLRPGQKGQPPLFLGFALGDYYPGVMATMGVLLALRWRDLTGQGQHVDISMYDATISLNELGIVFYSFTKQLAERGVIALAAPYGAFQAKDGYVVIAVVGEPIWARFCRAIGREDLLQDPSLQSGVERVKRMDDLLRPIVEGWSRDKTRAEVVEYLNRHGVPTMPVREVDDLFSCPHARARRMLLEVDDPVAGKQTVAGNPVKLSAVPDAPAVPPPQLGQHTEEVLSGLLGLREAELARLREAGVI